MTASATMLTIIRPAIRSTANIMAAPIAAFVPQAYIEAPLAQPTMARTKKPITEITNVSLLTFLAPIGYAGHGLPWLALSSCIHTVAADASTGGPASETVSTDCTSVPTAISS